MPVPFRTEIAKFDTKFDFNIQTPMLSMGSCFANEIGQRLTNNKFNIQVNPGGILFNPNAIFELLSLALKQAPFPEWSYLISQGRHLNYLLHSDVNASSKKALEEKGAILLSDLNNSLKHAQVLVLTFGTAMSYRLTENGQLVANCHKVPQKHFIQTLLTTREITDTFLAFKTLVQEVNPTIRFLLTVSPVRHIKDSIPLNSVSKSTLRLACHELSDNSEDVAYFPSYEILMDDLRDYRFYKKDMIHPNEQAIDYVWEKFATHCFDKQTQAFLPKWQQVRSAMAHRPFDSSSTAHQQFLKASIEKAENLAEQVDVSEEVAFLRAQLTSA